jgi:hypothetical protein
MGKSVLGISLDEAVATAGRPLRGTVWVNLDGEISGSRMALQLTGQEGTYIRYEETVRDGDGGTDYKTNEARGLRSIISLDFPVESASMIQPQGRILPGQYRLPFVVELPAILPATMHVSRGASSCDISYQLKAVLKGSGRLWNYSAQRDVVVAAAPLRREPVPFAAPPVTERVRFCCCVSGGTVTFGAAVSDARLDRGEACTVSVSCRNDSAWPVEGIEAALTETVQWQAQHRTETTEKTLATVEFPRFEGLDARGRNRAMAVESEQREREVIFREVSEGVHSGRVVMPVAAHNSFTGALIKCRHQITLTVKTGSCVSNPVIIIPIEAGEPREEEAPVQQAAPAPAAAAAAAPQQGLFADAAAVVTTASTVHVPGTAAVTGGRPVVSSDNEEPEVAISSPDTTDKPPSIETLLRDMEESLLDLDLLQRRAGDPAYGSVFEAMRPSDYFNVIRKVSSEFDQPAVAVLVAEKVPAFTCEYAVEALRAASEWNRQTIVERLLPHCTDLRQNQQRIKKELTDWEKTVTERAFQEALKN